MYISHYQYQKINRQQIDGRRLYSTPDGLNLPSVTSILEATKSEKSKKSLADWRKRTGLKRAQEITTESANRGTKMHSFLENYIKDSALASEPVNPFHRPSWEMAKKVISDGLKNCSEFWGIEVALYFPKIYAGTTDCVGIHNGVQSIIDFKQTNKPKKQEWIEDYFLQLCAYANAHNELFNTNINKGVIMMCVKPEVNNSGVIISEPVYQEFILEGADFAHYNNLWWTRVEQYYLLN